MHRLTVLGVVLLVAGSGAASAKPMPAGTPRSVQSLLDCRSIADSVQRLACYDKAAGSVAEAINKKDLVLIDKERATAAKRSLFGFSVPDFAGLLGGGDITQVEGTVAGFTNNADGG